MKIGYARVSSKGQNLSRQIKALTKNGVSKNHIYVEKVSGATISKRPQMQRLLANVKPKDIVYALAVDRLGRNANDIKFIIRTIEHKGATVNILNLPSLQGINNANLRALLDDLIIDLYSYQAEAERHEIKARQRQGIKIAKANGKYHGGKIRFHLSDNNVQTAIHQYFNRNHNKYTTVQIARLNGISIAELYRLIKRFKQNGYKFN